MSPVRLVILRYFIFICISFVYAESVCWFMSAGALSCFT